MPEIQRRKSVTVNIGGVRVGSDAPVVVQSMTNTDTADVESTVQQIAALARAGSELVRITVNNDDAAKAVPYIVEGIRAKGWTTPIIGDFHYNGHLLLTKYPDCARALAKYRINPGNVSIGRKDDDNFRTMVEVAVEHQKPVRIGVNWGSLDQALLTRMMDENSKLRRAARRPRRHDGGHGRLRARQRRRRRALRPAPRPDHPLRQGLRRPRPHRRLHRARRAAATTPCTSASPKPAWA